jgi:hypothetical protein
MRGLSECDARHRERPDGEAPDECSSVHH